MAVGSRRRRQRIFAGLKRFVKCEHFFQHHHYCPPIQQQMVKGPNQSIIPFFETEKGQPHHRRLAQIKTALAVCQKPIGKSIFALGFRDIAPIVLLHAHLDSVTNLLARLGQCFPLETGPQHVVPLGYALPRPFQSAAVQLLVQAAQYLLDIHPRNSRGQAVKQHAPLHRREWVPARLKFHFHLVIIER